MGTYEAISMISGHVEKHFAFFFDCINIKYNLSLLLWLNIYADFGFMNFYQRNEGTRNDYADAPWASAAGLRKAENSTGSSRAIELRYIEAEYRQHTP